jgi:hypothetical protein
MDSLVKSDNGTDVTGADDDHFYHEMQDNRSTHCVYQRERQGGEQDGREGND